jgi:RNA polymerase sigma factor (sigma-70 family)
MGRLSPRERAVVALTFYAERSTEDIARELATSSGNVRVVRHRALARLHECMEMTT